MFGKLRNIQVAVVTHLGIIPDFPPAFLCPRQSSRTVLGLELSEYFRSPPDYFMFPCDEDVEFRFGNKTNIQLFFNSTPLNPAPAEQDQILGPLFEWSEVVYRQSRGRAQCAKFLPQLISITL